MAQATASVHSAAPSAQMVAAESAPTSSVSLSSTACVHAAAAIAASPGGWGGLERASLFCGGRAFPRAHARTRKRRERARALCALQVREACRSVYFAARMRALVRSSSLAAQRRSHGLGRQSTAPEGDCAGGEWHRDSQRGTLSQGPQQPGGAARLACVALREQMADGAVPSVLAPLFGRKLPAASRTSGRRFDPILAGLNACI